MVNRETTKRPLHPACCLIKSVEYDNVSKAAALIPILELWHVKATELHPYFVEFLSEWPACKAGALTCCYVSLSTNPQIRGYHLNE